MKKQNPWLLPQNIQPIHYDITLKPNLKTSTFVGTEVITLTIKKPAATITMHSLDIRIKSANLSYVGQAEHIPTVKKIIFDKKREMVTFKFYKTLRPGEANLHLIFRGKINDQLCGFYKTTYRIPGKKRTYVGGTTQFEATDARRAFPCFDEPHQKAKFSITLIVSNTKTALSNMPVASETRHAGKKIICFQTSPRMSTYLIAFVVADLEYIEATDRNGVLIRIYTTPGKKEWGHFALEKTLHTLPYYAEKYKMPYPLPKLDLVAIPDFGSGAMENWGLEIFRETTLLIDPKNSAASARERVADVVDHELAHHWFGNLVTMLWWTHLWLNEGFANFAEAKAVASQFPKWNRGLRFIAEDVLGALNHMDKKSSHTIEIDVRNPAEIREIFDTTTYSGGASVNLMLEQYLGDETFREGIHQYLQRFKYGNADTNNLWQILGRASGKPVCAIMGSYTRQAGYPVIIAKENKEAKILSLKQQRFLFDGSKDLKHTRWNIPIGVITSKNPEASFQYMRTKQMYVPIDLNENDWVKLNPGTSALYRVAYSPELWKKLLGAIQKKQALSPADRLGLIDDAFALAKAGYIKTSDALECISACRAETEFYVWSTIARATGEIDTLVSQDAQCKEMFTSFARDLFRPTAERMGWENGAHNSNEDIFLRTLALRNLGGYGDKETIKEAQSHFQKFFATKELNPDLRGVVNALVAENGSEEEFEKFISIYNDTDFHEEKVRMLRAIAAFRDITTIKRALVFSLSEKVRPQDTQIILLNAGANNSAREMTWEFVKQNWKTFVRRYHGGSLSILSRLISIINDFATPEYLADAKHFLRKNAKPGMERAVKESLETIAANIAWSKRDSANIAEWLYTYQTTQTTKKF